MADPQSTKRCHTILMYPLTWPAWTVIECPHTAGHDEWHYDQNYAYPFTDADAAWFDQQYRLVTQQ